MPIRKRSNRSSHNPNYRFSLNRITVLIIIAFAVTGIIIIRLFYLQVIKHDYYQKIADKEHYGYSELPARRGEIFIKDYASGELVRVATNTTLDLLFADPTLITDKKIVADRIAPLIFDLAEAKKTDQDRIQKETVKAKTPEELAKIKSLTDEELYKNFHADLLNQISQNTRTKITLSNELGKETLAEIGKLNLAGIESNDTTLIAYPDQITDRTKIATILSPYLKISIPELANILKGSNRYVILKRKIKPEISTQIKKLINDDKTKNFSGLGLKEEYYRYYPEENLGANILGFVTPQGIGQYGIEGKYNTQLQGKKGVFEAQKDSIGRQITVGDTVIQPAVDGDNIILSIDRSIQMNTEKILAKAVYDFNADSGQVIVMDPKTGKIMAMANYPTFNPNNFSEAYALTDIQLNPDEIANLVPIETEPDSFWFYRDLITEDRLKIFKVQNKDGTITYKKYKNKVGPAAYQNKTVAEPYEPGSIFKIITMATAIDDGDVIPSTSIDDPGFAKFDKYKKDDQLITVKNVSSKCTGRVNMTWIIQNSCNTGMSWVAKKIGRNLLYNYMLKFGFSERTGIEFDEENPGKIQYFDKWADIDLANHAFGQGITVTPLQMISSYAVIANKGVLMEPHIVETIQKQNGKDINTDTSPVQRVVSEQTAATITAMLTNNVENGDSYSKIRFPDHYIGAKTGTAQTYRNDEALKGAGTTFTTVVGFAPIKDPKFVILAKLDRPRSSEWADQTAAVLFHNVADYLFNYFSLPPDKK